MWFNSTQREEPYLGSNGWSTIVETRLLRKEVQSRCCMAVVSSFVRCWVKSRNERNPRPVLPWGKTRNSQETASDKLEEGGDDVKSSWPLCPGLHTCYNGRYNPSPTRKGEPIGKNRSQFGLQAATRLHEAGIASNGRSARCREYVPGPCTHRPSHHESGLY